MALKPVSKGLPWAWAATGANMRTLSTISTDFPEVEKINNQRGEGSLIRAKFGMRASGSDSSEPLLLVHRSAREGCCLMTSRRDVIPHAHKTGIWGTSVGWSVTCHGELRAHCFDMGKYGMDCHKLMHSTGSSSIDGS